jgi:hypothetical protein
MALSRRRGRPGYYSFVLVVVLQSGRAGTAAPSDSSTNQNTSRVTMARASTRVGTRAAGAATTGSHWLADSGVSITSTVAGAAETTALRSPSSGSRRHAAQARTGSRQKQEVSKRAAGRSAKLNRGRSTGIGFSATCQTCLDALMLQSGVIATEAASASGTAIEPEAASDGVSSSRRSSKSRKTKGRVSGSRRRRNGTALPSQ